jgi:ATP-dependent Clp protease ATP-binding subunit ClpC
MDLSTSSRTPPAADLTRTLQEARAIADGVGQPLTTAHLLLALFTVPNPAEVLLAERDVDEDVLLDFLRSGGHEPSGCVKRVLDQAEQTALRCDARQANTLHLLVGFFKVKDAVAHRLLEQAIPNLPQFRNMVLSFVTGVLPRRLLQPMQDARQTTRRPPRDERPRASDPRNDWVVPKGTLIDGGLPSSLEEDDLPKKVGSPRPLPDSVVAASADDEIVDDYESLLSEPPEPVKTKQKAKPKRFHITTLPTLPPTAYDLDPDNFPWLSSLGRNLSSLAALGELDPVVGRSAEVTQIIDVLGKRRANNPCLVGEPGVGKTAIAEGLAVKLVHGDPEVAPLEGKLIIELDMGRITAGTALRGSFSERMQGLKKDVQRAAGKVIVFIDEIHTLMGAGASGESPQDAANELKAALARGVFPCIGSTTLDEYRKHIEADPAMERRFVKILIEEPDDDACIQIMRGAAPLYEDHHRVEVSDDAIAAAVQLSSRFIHDRMLPGKALDLLDLSMSRARRSGIREVQREEVARVCAEVSKVPIDRVLLDDAARFLEMEPFLEKRVVGHAPVIARVAESIRRNYAGFVNQRPMGSFLFLGPTGVGKTELAKTLADFLYGSPDALTRIDMSEFGESHTAARLVGSPPGYVGHSEGGQLTEALRRRPHCVVLLDEIEKAHPDILPLLLQILDEGRLTDSKGRTVSFRHAVVVMTSNLGAVKPGKKTRKVGFSTSDDDHAKQDMEAALEAARGYFAPELWGRIEDKLVFGALGSKELKQIAALLLAESSGNLKTTRNIVLEWDDGVLGALVDEAGDGREAGARYMRQAVQRVVESPLSEAILRKEVREGDQVRLRADKKGRILARRVAQ